VREGKMLWGPESEGVGKVEGVGEGMRKRARKRERENVHARYVFSYAQDGGQRRNFGERVRERETGAGTLLM
jgi:hypothetical protein